MEYLEPFKFFFLGCFITFNVMKAAYIYRKPKTFEIREV
jgi:hypothetical protein